MQLAIRIFNLYFLKKKSLKISKRQSEAMAKKKKDKRAINGLQNIVVLHIWHLLCYSCYKTDDEEKTGL
jgi:hypothetical protein